jgi:hypothetical protein
MDMSQNIAVGYNERNLCFSFSNSVLNKSKLLKISDDISLKNFIELVYETQIDSGPQTGSEGNKK